MKIGDLVKALVEVAEKGANIARIIRSESSLLDLLVQEKKGSQKNTRFDQDFKTLADVLVQEVVRYDLSQKFPGIGDSIFGEESNKFTNTLGDSVTVQVQSSAEKTKHLLSMVLEDNTEAASILADVVHTSITMDTVNTDTLDQVISVDDVGVWIDPIDSTAQYIHGDVGEVTNGLAAEGLQCVCVLIGVYDKNTGLPIIGVTNQPFYTQAEDGKWTGYTTWGVCYKDIKANSLETSQAPVTQDGKPVILISSSEAEAVQSVLKEKFSVRHVAGAGYKLLGVSQNLADAYVLTKSSNYKWDCCGPHAILRSLGGGIVNFTEVSEFVKDNLKECNFSKFMQIKYHLPDQPELTGSQRWCNDGGIIAYLSQDTLEKIGHAIINV